MARQVVVVSGVRTPIGNFGGSLKDIPPSELAAQCVREAVRRTASILNSLAMWYSAT